jgi:hypothetical protein
MGKHITPLEVCERLIGHIRELGPICGLGTQAAYLWRHANSSRDAGDIPSGPNQRALLDHSDRHGLGLTALHLIRGADEAEIAAILAARGQPQPPAMEAAE